MEDFSEYALELAFIPYSSDLLVEGVESALAAWQVILELPLEVLSVGENPLAEALLDVM